MKYGDCIFGFLHSGSNSPAFQPWLDPHTISLNVNSLKSWVSHVLKQRRQDTDLCKLSFPSADSDVPLCVPFPHRFSPPLAPPFPPGWDCLWGLIGICSMPWARSGLQCFFPPHLNLPFGGSWMLFPVFWPWVTLGLKPSFERQRGQKSEFLGTRATITLCPIW